MIINNGSLDLSFSSIESLGNLKEVRGTAKYLKLMNCKKLISFGKLKKVTFYINAWGCENLTSIGDLEEVGSLNLTNCINLKDLKNLKIAKELILKGSGITEEYIRKQKPYLLSKCRWSNLWT